MTTSSNALPPVRITSYVDFIEVVPLMLGFRPRESLVMVLISEQTMSMAARLDLPRTPEAVMAVTAQCGELASRYDATQIVLIGFTATPAAQWGMFDHLVTGLHPHEVEVLVTDDVTYWSAADDPGLLLPSARFTDHAHFAGRPVLGDRDELADTVSGPSWVGAATRAAMACADEFTAHSTLVEELALLSELIHAHDTAPDGFTIEARILAASLVDDPTVREHARLSITHDNAEQQVHLWRSVVEVTPDELATGPLCLLGMAAWLTGHGAMLQVCVERAEWLSPDDEMVDFLAALVEAAVDPRTWQEWPAVHESWRDDAVS